MLKIPPNFVVQNMTMVATTMELLTFRKSSSGAADRTRICSSCRSLIKTQPHPVRRLSNPYTNHAACTHYSISSTVAGAVQLWQSRCSASTIGTSGASESELTYGPETSRGSSSISKRSIDTQYKLNTCGSHNYISVYKHTSTSTCSRSTSNNPNHNHSSPSYLNNDQLNLSNPNRSPESQHSRRTKRHTIHPIHPQEHSSRRLPNLLLLPLQLQHRPILLRQPMRAALRHLRLQRLQSRRRPRHSSQQIRHEHKQHRYYVDLRC